MTKFRKKPVVIEATQYFPGVVIPGVTYSVPVRDGEVLAGMVAYIDTLEGRMEVSPGDWVITGIKGEKYPCRDDIFRATYDPVD